MIAGQPRARSVVSSLVTTSITWPWNKSKNCCKTLLRRLLCPFLFSMRAYAPGQLALAWGSLHAAALTRLRSGRCFYADPTEVAPTGRPPRHGYQFACADPTTWLEPDQEYTTDDSQYGQVHVRAWHHLHAIPQNHPRRGTRGPRPVMRGALILVEVAQLPKQTRVPKQLWLWWHAPDQPSLPLVWRAYIARFMRSAHLPLCQTVSRARPYQGCVILNKPIVGPGWSYSLTHNYVWPDLSWLITAC